MTAILPEVQLVQGWNDPYDEKTEHAKFDPERYIIGSTLNAKTGYITLWVRLK